MIFRHAAWLRGFFRNTGVKAFAVHALLTVPQHSYIIASIRKIISNIIAVLYTYICMFLYIYMIIKQYCCIT